MHPHLIHASLGLLKSKYQAASRSARVRKHFPPKSCSFAWDDLDPHQIHGSLGPPESTTQTESRFVQPFLHSSRRSVVEHSRGMSFPVKIAPLIGRSGPPCNRWFLGPTNVQIPHVISIGLAVFAQLIAERPYIFTTGAALCPQNSPFPLRDVGPI